MSAVYESALAQEESALDLAVAAGALVRCDVCGEVWNHGGDPVAAYKLGNWKLSQASSDTAAFDSDERREMTDAVKDAIEMAPDQCECRRKMARDD